MDDENKTVAIYGNSYTHYNNNVNTRLRDLARSLLPERGKGYAYRGITISTGHLGGIFSACSSRTVCKSGT